MAFVENKPNEVAIQFGTELAKMVDVAEQHLLERSPEARTRCGSCAFRAGTLQNGCLDTVATAMKCVFEKHPFMCHESPGKSAPCAGWAASVNELKETPPLEIPWEFPEEPSEADLAAYYETKQT